MNCNGFFFNGFSNCRFEFWYPPHMWARVMLDLGPDHVNCSLKFNCRKNFLGRCDNYCLRSASPIFILQFTFSSNSLISTWCKTYLRCICTFASEWCFCLAKKDVLLCKFFWDEKCSTEIWTLKVVIYHNFCQGFQCVF